MEPKTTIKEIFVLFLKKKKALGKFMYYLSSKDPRLRGPYVKNSFFETLEYIKGEDIYRSHSTYCLVSEYFVWAYTKEGHDYWCRISEDWRYLLVMADRENYSLEKLKDIIIEVTRL